MPSTCLASSPPRRCLRTIAGVATWLVLLLGPAVMASCARTSDAADDGNPGGAGGRTATGGVQAPGAATATGGATGTSTVNVHECASAYQLPLPADLCLGCEPLPAGATDGCPPPLNCSDVDKTSQVRYPKDCYVVFPWQNQYWPNSLQQGSCDDTHWNCWL